MHFECTELYGHRLKAQEHSSAYYSGVWSEQADAAPPSTQIL